MKAGQAVSHIRFSIVITCYNQPDFIRDAVDSALLQHSPSKEIIVVDDGSTDGSAQVLRHYGESIQLLRFPRNRGAIEARNHGAAHAEGEYLVFLDGDDVFLPWALDVYERIIAERHPAFILGRYCGFTGAVPSATEREPRGKVELVEYASLMAKDRGFGMSASSFVVEKRVFQQVGGWSAGIFHLDCVDLAAKLGFLRSTVLIRAPYTVLYRMHVSNSIRTVPPFLQMAHRILRKERSGEYPGGRGFRFERYAWFGGIVVFWVRRALRAKHYRDAARLGASGLPMILASIFKRSTACITGRRPFEILDLPQQWNQPRAAIYSSNRPFRAAHGVPSGAHS